jgi:hypothetical protein
LQSRSQGKPRPCGRSRVELAGNVALTSILVRMPEPLF